MRKYYRKSYENEEYNPNNEYYSPGNFPEFDNARQNYQDMYFITNYIDTSFDQATSDGGSKNSFLMNFSTNSYDSSRYKIYQVQIMKLTSFMYVQFEFDEYGIVVYCLLNFNYEEIFWLGYCKKQFKTTINNSDFINAQRDIPAMIGRIDNPNDKAGKNIVILKVLWLQHIEIHIKDPDNFILGNTL